MKRVRIKMLLALAVALLMTFAVSGLVEAGGIYGPIGGPAVIFPYIIKDDPNMTTVISLIVPNGDGSNNDAAELHYAYIYKDTDAAQTASCEEYDFKGVTSPNDLVTFDVAGMYGDAAGEEGLPLFNDTTSDPLIEGSSLALTVGPSHGYLLVEVLDSDNVTGGTLYSPDGEALILDIANGGAWGYRAFSGYDHHDEQAILWNDDAVDTVVYPTAIANTEFTITPFSANLLDSGGYDSVILQDRTVVIQAMSNENGAAVIYDRNENTLSATTEKAVTCVGVATLDELLSSGILNNPAFIAQGGWAYLANKGTGLNHDHYGDDAFVYKVESSSGLGGFMINGQANGGWSIDIGGRN